MFEDIGPQIALQKQIHSKFCVDDDFGEKLLGLLSKNMQFQYPSEETISGPLTSFHCNECCFAKSRKMREGLQATF